MGVRLLTALVAATLACNGLAQTLLIDDFEAYAVGAEPPKNAWDHIKGNAFDGDPPAMIMDDPLRPWNKVYAHSGQRLYGSEDSFTDFTWEFDWMVDADVNTSVAWRIETPTTYYYFTRRRRGKILWIFRLNGNSTLLNEGDDEWASVPNKWYTTQISSFGQNHTVKMKDWDPLRRFADVDPIASVENGDVLAGPIGFWGANGGTLYVDNVHVYGAENPGFYFAVEPAGKLVSTWASIKQR
jgi:hypothetical protein